LERLILNNNCLKDQLAPTIGKLHHLEVLNLQDNQLNGPFPLELCTLPKLRILNLSKNHLSGRLPDELGMLTQLETLVLTDNFLRGPIPFSVSQLTQLRDFSVFKSHPQVEMRVPRGFTKKQFHRIFVEGPIMGVDAICWDDQVVFGVTEKRRTPIVYDYVDDLPTPPPEETEETRPPTPEKWKRAILYNNQSS
jgi:Leucine rich repeat